MFSVIIPTIYRASLPNAIASVDRQIYPADAVLVCGRGRTAAENRNIAARRAYSPWLAFLDDDDLFLPYKLEVLRTAIASEPNAALVYSPYTVADPPSIDLVPPVCQYQIERPDQAMKAFTTGNYLAGSCVAIRNDVFIMSGGFDESLPVCEVYDLGIRLAMAGHNFCKVSVPLVWRDIESGNRLTHLTTSAHQQRVRQNYGLVR